MPEENYGLRAGEQTDVRTFDQEVTQVGNFNDALADASGAEMIDITQESGRQTPSLRMGLLILNYGHDEIYGSMVAQLGKKNVVPAACEPCLVKK
jgi:hypothetical protein